MIVNLMIHKHTNSISYFFKKSMINYEKFGKISFTMREDVVDVVVKSTVIFLILAIIGGGAVMISPTVLRRQGLTQQERELNQRIETKKREIATLIDNQHRFKTDPDFVEKIARLNNRVFPGELVFIFDDAKE